jgi:hypothetical protein
MALVMRVIGTAMPRVSRTPISVAMMSEAAPPRVTAAALAQQPFGQSRSGRIGQNGSPNRNEIAAPTCQTSNRRSVVVVACHGRECGERKGERKGNLLPSVRHHSNGRFCRYRTILTHRGRKTCEADHTEEQKG